MWQFTTLLTQSFYLRFVCRAICIKAYIQLPLYTLITWKFIRKRILKGCVYSDKVRRELTNRKNDVFQKTEVFKMTNSIMGFVSYSQKERSRTHAFSLPFI